MPSGGNPRPTVPRKLGRRRIRIAPSGWLADYINDEPLSREFAEEIGRYRRKIAQDLKAEMAALEVSHPHKRGRRRRSSRPSWGYDGVYRGTRTEMDEDIQGFFKGD